MSGKKYAFTILGLALLGALYAFIYGRIEKHKMRVLPKKYIYDRYSPPNVDVLFIRTLKYKKPYFEYVEDDSIRKKDQIPISFPSENFLPEGEIIYVRRYLSDSDLIEFYSPKYHHRLWGFKTGYVYKGFIHDNPRTESYK